MEILSDRISIVRKDDGASIVISSVANKKKNRFVAALLILWVVGGATMIGSFRSIDEDKTKVVVIIWFAFWMYFLYVLWKLWRWKQYGYEVIKIVGDKMKYKKDVKGRGWVNDFALAGIQKMRVSDSKSPAWLKNFGGEFWNTDCDSLRFDYEDREIALGHQLDAEDQKRLLKIFSEFVAMDEKVSNRSKKAENRKS